MKEEWLPFETKNAALKGKFLCGYIDKKKTKLRKCIKCGNSLTCTKGNTSVMTRHLENCVPPPECAENQNSVGIQEFMKRDSEKYEFQSQFIYLDNIPITKVCNSGRFRKLFKRAGYLAPNYDDLNNSLNAQYVNRVEQVKQYLNKDTKLIIALDKWTNKQQEKFIGVYVYQMGVRVFLGLLGILQKCRVRVRVLQKCRVRVIANRVLGFRVLKMSGTRNA